MAAVLRRAAAALYGAAVRARNASYEAGFLRVHKIEGLRVISIGNLRVGGTSKSPLSLKIGALLRERGVPCAVVLRGYRGRLSRQGAVVSLGEGPLIGWRESGDEAYLAAQTTRGIAVVIGANRVAAAQQAAALGAKAVVLDDGFQHRRLARDLNIALTVPGDLDPGAALLPEGALRESAEALCRADLLAGSLQDWTHREPRPPLLFRADAVSLVGPSQETAEISLLNRRRVFLLAGIARPERLRATALECGAEIAGELFFADHHPFSLADLARAERLAAHTNAELIVTTEKDLLRLPPLAPSVPVWAIRIELRFAAGQEELCRCLDSTLSLAPPRAGREPG